MIKVRRWWLSDQLPWSWTCTACDQEKYGDDGECRNLVVNWGDAMDEAESHLMLHPWRA